LTTSENTGLSQPQRSTDAPGAGPSVPSPQTAAVQMTNALPLYDAALVGPVAARVQIVTIELTQAQFSRADGGHFPDAAVGDRRPDKFGIDVSWQLDESGRALSCLLSFGTLFDASPPPYELRATFRLLYEVSAGDALSPEQLNTFAYWNARFNAWPYWREYLSSTLNRAGLPRFLVPVMGVPR
jgi:hypothetical protein